MPKVRCRDRMTDFISEIYDTRQQPTSSSGVQGWNCKEQFYLFNGRTWMWYDSYTCTPVRQEQ